MQKKYGNIRTEMSFTRKIYRADLKSIIINSWAVNDNAEVLNQILLYYQWGVSPTWNALDPDVWCTSNIWNTNIFLAINNSMCLRLLTLLNTWLMNSRSINFKEQKWITFFTLELTHSMCKKAETAYYICYKDI